MKFAISLPFAAGVAAGYVLGAAAGRSRYQQLKSAAQDLTHHPKVQQTVFDLADRAKAQSSRLPGPAARVVDTAATRLEEKMTNPSSSPVGPDADLSTAEQPPATDSTLA